MDSKVAAGRSVYARAVRRIQVLHAELDRLETFIATFEELAREPEDRLPEQASEEDAGGSVSAPAVRLAGNAGEGRRAASVAELEAAVVEVLVEHGAPLKRMHLFERVKARGVVIGGEHELVNFGSKLSRSQRLVNLPGHGYWPKDRPYAPAGYSPRGEASQAAS